MNLSDIQPGMEIEYINCPDKRKSPITRTGIVRQVTSRMIAVQGKRYPDTILVNDLLSEKAKILNLGEGEIDMAKKQAPEKEILLNLWHKHGKIDPIRKELGESWGSVRMWLKEAEIIDQFNTPLIIPDPKLVDAKVIDQPAGGSEPEPKTELTEHVDRQLKRHIFGPLDLIKCDDCGQMVHPSAGKTLYPELHPVEQIRIVCLDCFGGYTNQESTEPFTTERLENLGRIKEPANIPPPLVMPYAQELPRARVPYTLTEYNKAIGARQEEPATGCDDQEEQLKIELIAAILYQYKGGTVNSNLALKCTRGILDLGVA